MIIWQLALAATIGALFSELARLIIPPALRARETPNGASPACYQNDGTDNIALPRGSAL
jgi:hypothetical protein